METLLLVAIIVVGVSSLYVAATFNRRTRRNAAPLMNEAVKGISRQVVDTGENLSQQLHEIDVQMQQERELIDQDISRTQERLDHADMRLSSVASQLSGELATIKHQSAQLGESLARLSAQVAGIESYIRSQKTQGTANLGRVEGSIRDMGEGPPNSHN